MQVFVRGLDSRTLACEVEACCSVGELKQRVEDVEGVPSSSQGLVFGGRQLDNERSLASYGVGPASTLHLVLRLRGGKGGFGALLRGLGRDGSKTTNNDAMRDLQGRRLRHSNAEQKLKEWEGKAKERELEKIALQHIKEQQRQAKKEQEAKVEVKSIIQAHKAAVAGVQDAVQSALADAKKAAKAGGSGAAAPAAAAALPGKRPAAAAVTGAAMAGAGPAAKKSRMLAAIESFGSESEEGTSDEEDEGAGSGEE